MVVNIVISALVVMIFVLIYCMCKIAKVADECIDLMEREHHGKDKETD